MRRATALRVPRAARWGILSLPLVLLLAPSGLALEAVLTLETPDPIRLSGQVAAEAYGGTMHVEAPRLSGTAVLEGVSGSLSIWTFRTASLGTVRPERVPASAFEERQVVLENATLRLHLRDEGFYATLASEPAGAARVAGPVRPGMGHPVAVDAAVMRGSVPSTPVLRTPPAVPWRWDAGWPYVGSGMDTQRAGFPRWDAPVLEVEGSFSIAAEGGNLTVLDGAAGVRSYRLGQWEETSTVPGGPAVEVVQTAIFRGRAAAGAIPLGGEWGFAAPAMSWRVDGSAAWTSATGRASTPEGETRVERAAVEAVGRFEVAPREAPRAPSEVQPVRYGSTGDFAALRLGGQPLGAPSGPGVPEAAAAVTLLALLLALLAGGRDLAWRVVGVLFTRISRERILDHPARRRLHELVAAEPGIHLRELQRRMGGSWGSTAFHLQMLAQARRVRLEKRGRYTHVFLAGDAPSAAFVPHPVARRIHEAIPPDGSPIPWQRLRAQVDVSHQLLSYHLRALAARRLVTFPPPPRGNGRLVARAPAPAAGDAPQDGAQAGR